MMGKKYIIELEDKPVCVFDEDTQTFFPRLHRVKGFNSLVFDQNGLDKLTPYTEPDLNAIRKEAYAEGYKEGMQLSIDDAKLKEEYKRGLNDAWECARKIYLPEDHGGFGYKLREKIFNTYNAGWLFKNLSASEAIEKIRQYEQEKKDIRIGDEVIYDGKRCVVVFPQTEHLQATVLECGRFHHTHVVEYDELTQTGRHVPELVEILQKMKEES